VALNGAAHMLAMPTAGDVGTKCGKGGRDPLCDKTTLDASYFLKMLGKWDFSHDHDRDTLLADPSYLDAVQAFASDDGQAAFFEALASAWGKLSVADRFDGPLGNQCGAGRAALKVEPTTMRREAFPSALSFAGWIAIFGLGMLFGGRLVKSHLVGLNEYRPSPMRLHDESCS